MDAAYQCTFIIRYIKRTYKNIELKSVLLYLQILHFLLSCCFFGRKSASDKLVTKQTFINHSVLLTKTNTFDNIKQKGNKRIV